MTNDELNRRVAELRGWTEQPTAKFGPNIWMRPDGGLRPLPDYCTDPAAWGALFVALAGEGYCPSIQAEFANRYIATVGRANASAATPGAGLCLAYIVSREGK